MVKKVLLFGDIGIDDTVALIYAWLNKEVEIVGLVADYGNVSREDAMSNIYYVMKLFNFPRDIPVILGAEVPLTGEQPTYYPEIHGIRGLGPIVPNDDEYELKIENFFEIVSIIENYKDEELIIVNIGRLTSLATMFILYNDLMKNIKEYYIMGGAFWVPGNVTTVAEANFHGDPIAVNIVLTYATNVTIIPLNATQKAIVTPGMVDYIDSFGQTKIFKPLMEYYTRFYQERDPSLLGSPVHDALTLMATTSPEMFIFESYPVKVVDKLEGPARGQSIAETRPYESVHNGEKKHRIAFDIHYDMFFHQFMSVMTGQM
ncbi:nucleoside hydrolase [Lysinibacillus boronitolerans]|uniref:Nucleoside hydrolase n=1 Tax=Lysinibacillus boronitolerans JCM 21713 = 10a = NBRC 103108 TaxID=1294264 RepID=A0ABR4XWE7_9BACI|nr:nucleoside hydrolase [Lysinibacillus boronitolerans]KGR83038.1 nucleoside hydrolase [Lysinibacillus boronitolerans JCM 21713 = 10a = NBRC 103108]